MGDLCRVRDAGGQQGREARDLAVGSMCEGKARLQPGLGCCLPLGFGDLGQWASGSVHLAKESGLKSDPVHF